jgi:hypothetical protein
MMAFAGCVHPTQSEIWGEMVWLGLLIAPLLWLGMSGKQEQHTPSTNEVTGGTPQLCVALVILTAIAWAVIKWGATS